MSKPFSKADEELIISLVNRNKSTKEIALELNRSDASVQAKRLRLYEKNPGLFVNWEPQFVPQNVFLSKEEMLDIFTEYMSYQFENETIEKKHNLKNRMIFLTIINEAKKEIENEEKTISFQDYLENNKINAYQFNWG